MSHLLGSNKRGDCDLALSQPVRRHVSMSHMESLRLKAEQPGRTLPVGFTQMAAQLPTVLASAT